MSLNIKSREAEDLVRELAALTGESLTGAITVALRERLARIKQEQESRTATRTDRLLEIAADAAPRWREPYRGAEHGDLLYDDVGLPR